MAKPVRVRSNEVRRTLTSYRFPRASVTEVIKKFYESIDSPVSLGCWLQYEASEYADLVGRSLDPKDYNNPQAFRDDYAAISFLSKSQFLKTGIDLKENALSVFKDAEEQCRLTNNRLSNLASDPLFKGPNVWLLNSTVQKIARILGDPSSSSRSDEYEAFVNEFLDCGAFGPGVSLLIKGNDTSSVRKFREERQITVSLYRLIEPLLPTAYPLWFRDGKLKNLEFVNSSKVITVPKNAKTDRTIAVEPGINIWFQKSLGRMIRSRLRKNGLELNSNDKNLHFAHLGSKGLGYATVDFKSASDTIATKTVKELLPPFWFELLDAARSRSYTLNNKVHRFEKFSSMGNGFTFELESLIFYAAALSVTERNGCDMKCVSVFGDDVVLPSCCFDEFVEFTRFLGFTVNPKKSFSSGHFRESCGSYWFDGLNVKPLFFKKDLSHANTVINLINGINNLAHLRNGLFGRDARFQDLHTYLINTLPEVLRLRGDVTGGSGCIHSNFDECLPIKAKNQIEGYFYWAFVIKSVACETDSPALLVARLATTSEVSFGNTYALRSVTSIRKKRVFVPRWYNFGSWF